jgi:hypothetical protein
VRNFGKLLATLANPIASPLTIRRAARSLRVSKENPNIYCETYEMVWARSKSVPQGLKPRCEQRLYGTDESVPLSKTTSKTSFQQPQYLSTLSPFGASNPARPDGGQ